MRPHAGGPTRARRSRLGGRPGSHGGGDGAAPGDLGFGEGQVERPAGHEALAPGLADLGRGQPGGARPGRGPRPPSREPPRAPPATPTRRSTGAGRRRRDVEARRPATAISASATAIPPCEQSCTPATTRSPTSPAVTACRAAAVARSAAADVPRAVRGGRPTPSAELGARRAQEHDAVAARAARAAGAGPGAWGTGPAPRPRASGRCRRPPTRCRGSRSAHHGMPSASQASAMPSNHLAELPHHLGVLGVAEVEAVDQGPRLGTRAGDVACRFHHGQAPAGPGIEGAVAAGAVGARAIARSGVPGTRRTVASAPGDHGVEEELVVVLAPDPLLLGDVRGRQERQELPRRVRAVGEPLAERDGGVVALRASRSAGRSIGRL